MNKSFIGAICLIVGFFVGYSINKTQFVSNTYAIRDNNVNSPLVKPLLAVGNISPLPTPQYKDLNDQVSKYIYDNSAIGDDTSVYFIDYGKGGRFAINENQQYAPSSLMKVAVMIAYFKKAQDDPSILESKLVYQKDMEQALDAVQFDTPSTLVVGNSYSVSNLIDSMIIQSDNGAMNVLIDNIGYPYLNTIYSDLGLKGPSANQSDYTISPSDYSLFFRILYNATYLNVEMSERALSILSRATFADGITSALPSGTLVAHKFGEHVYGTSNSNIQAIELHDCGIVYLPNDPYFLCIMTHGSSISALEDRIKDISQIVYGGVMQIAKKK